MSTEPDLDEETDNPAEDPAEHLAEEAPAEQVADEKPAEHLAEEEPAGEEPAPRRRQLVAILLAVALVIVAGLAVLEWRSGSDLSAEKSARRAVATRSGAFGKALMTYDYRNMPQARDAVLRLTAGTFTDMYKGQFDAAVAPAATREQAVSTASVTGVFVGDVDGDTAAAIVVVDSQVRSPAGTKKTTGTHLELKLTRQGGRWKVTTVTPLGALSEQAYDPGGKPIQPPKKP